MITAECNASEGEAAQRRKVCLLLLSLSHRREKGCLPANLSLSLTDFRRIRFLRVFTYALRQDT